MERRSKIQRTLLLLFSITAGILSFFSCVTEEGSNSGIQNHIQPGDTIPHFTAWNPDGDSWNSAALTGKRGVIVLFTIGCPDCTRELPKIEAVWQEFNSEPDFILATFSRNDSGKEAKEYWEKQSFNMPWYADPEKKIFNLFANSYVPRIYLTNTKGRVTWMAIENFNLTAKELIEMVRKLE